MTPTDNPESGAPGGLAVATVAHKRRLSLVWLLPLVALLAGAWLIWKTLSERGPTITITFQTAAGIEPGKTQIRFREVQLGVVQKVALSEDLQQVIVTARMEKAAEDELRQGTQFWIESARVTAAGVSGLGTLLSGAYIGMRPGGGEPAREFTALDVAPVYQVDTLGKRFLLRAESLGSVSAGAPIYFRGIAVGGVLGHRLEPSGDRVSIFAFVSAPYDALVREQSRFWNASGFDVSVGVAGVNVRTESVVSILAGGIAFDTPVEATASPAAGDNSEFPLYRSYDAVQQARYTVRVPMKMYFQGSVAGLDVGAPVVAYGIKMGEVTDVRMVVDPETLQGRIPVTIALEPQRWTTIGDPNPSAERVLARVARYVENGLRAQLQSGNLLTGQKIIGIDVFPNAPRAAVTVEEGIAVIPTVPSDIEVLSEKANAFIDKLDKAPIAELVADLRNTVQSADRLLASAAVREGVEGLRGIGPLLDSLRQTSEAAGTTLESAQGVIGNESALRGELARTMRELAAAARAVRALSELLENNPSALILGRPGPE